jgi:hypothetical protein
MVPPLAKWARVSSILRPKKIATWPDMVIAGRVLQPDYDLRDLRLPPPESPSAPASSTTSADAVSSNCSRTVSGERV